jgi:GNAT superfamily N-acetyltransferase
MNLPAGLTTRTFTIEDAAAVTALMAAQELHDVGEVVIEEADIVGDWQRPSFDLASSGVGVYDGNQLVGYAEVSGHDRGDAAVLPAYRGRGIGTWLARWMQDNARSKGSRVVGMPVPEGSAGDRLLEALGYHVRWTSWVLQLPEGQAIMPQPLPDGYTIRSAQVDEGEQVWTVIEDAFLEWSTRDRQSYDDFVAQVFQRPGFAPWQLRVAVDPEGAVVGSAFVIEADGHGYVDRLAVRKDQRHKGLARALLVDAFAIARGQGATRSELSTDSRTGALSLYERVGMVVTSTWVNRAITLSD